MNARENKNLVNVCLCLNFWVCKGISEKQWDAPFVWKVLQNYNNAAGVRVQALITTHKRRDAGRLIYSHTSFNEQT